MKTIIQSARLLLVLTALTGIAYPLAVTGISRMAFRAQSEGSVIQADGKAIGSELLAQKTENPRYFWPRPSAADFATVASGASNKGPTSADLAKTIAERREKYGTDAPVEMLTASGSGLDPHLSPAAAIFQVARIAKARNLNPERIHRLIADSTEARQLGFLGEPRVNVLKLNLALDALK